MEQNSQGNIYRGLKSKTIKAIIRKKINDWLVTIEDSNVKALASRGTIVTGGSIASMLRGEPVNDFDVYFRDYETAFKVAQYYLGKFNPKNGKGINCKKYLADGDGHEIKNYPDERDPDINHPSNRIKIIIKSAGVASEEGSEKPYQYFEGTTDDSAAQYLHDIVGINETGDIASDYEEVENQAQNVEDDTADAGAKFRPVFLSTNAITLSNKVQLVIRFHGEPDQIHENYDFVHCTNYWTSWNDSLNLRQAALEAIMTKELRYVGSRYPLCSLIRLRKFIKRGWTINAGQILKIVMQLQTLDLNNVRVLEDQMVGVDTAYFSQVIQALKSKNTENIDSTYLVELIDKLF